MEENIIELRSKALSPRTATSCVLKFSGRPSNHDADFTIAGNLTNKVMSMSFMWTSCPSIINLGLSENTTEFPLPLRPPELNFCPLKSVLDVTLVWSEGAGQAGVDVCLLPSDSVKRCSAKRAWCSVMHL